MSDVYNSFTQPVYARYGLYSAILPFTLNDIHSVRHPFNLNSLLDGLWYKSMVRVYKTKIVETPGLKIAHTISAVVLGRIMRGLIPQTRIVDWRQVYGFKPPP